MNEKKYINTDEKKNKKKIYKNNSFLFCLLRKLKE